MRIIIQSKMHKVKCLMHKYNLLLNIMHNSTPCPERLCNMTPFGRMQMKTIDYLSL